MENTIMSQYKSGRILFAVPITLSYKKYIRITKETETITRTIRAMKSFP